MEKTDGKVNVVLYPGGTIGDAAVKHVWMGATIVVYEGPTVTFEESGRQVTICGTWVVEEAVDEG